MERVSGRGWVIVVNNYDNNDIQRFTEVATNETTTRCAIMGQETAPTTGTQHLQCYIQFKKTQRLSAVRKLFNHGTHIELAKGSAAQNREYCQKEGNFKEYGIDIVEYVNQTYSTSSIQEVSQQQTKQQQVSSIHSKYLST